MTAARYLQALDDDEVTRLARLALGRATLRVTGWTSSPLTSGRSGASVYRLSGTARDGAAAVPWSLILKLCTNVRRFGVELDGATGRTRTPSSTSCAVLGTIYALSYTGIANGIVEDRIAQRARDAYKITPGQLLEHMGAVAAFCADQGDEARRLAGLTERRACVRPTSR